MTRIKLRRTATCPVCKRKITLIKHSGTLRRHMSSPGVVCAGAWRKP